MKIALAVLTAATLLAGCHPAANTAGNAVATNTAAPAAEDYLTRIDKLNEAQLHMVLFRAIRDAQQDCQDVTKTERLEDQDAKHLWRVTCRGGGQFAVLIGSDGIANVTAATARS